MEKVNENERVDNDVNFCSYCGNKLSEDAVFCNHCGKQVKGNLKQRFHISVKYRIFCILYLLWLSFHVVFLSSGDPDFSAYTCKKYFWGIDKWDLSYYDFSEFATYCFVIPILLAGLIWLLTLVPWKTHWKKILKALLIIIVVGACAIFACISWEIVAIQAIKSIFIIVPIAILSGISLLISRWLNKEDPEAKSTNEETGMPENGNEGCTDNDKPE